jgi:hypothetical protein
MKYTTIKELQDLDDGMPVAHFKGVIKDVKFPPKNGSTEYGDWQAQSAWVTDGESNISVSFMNFKHPDANGKNDPFLDLRNYIGTEFTADCSKSDKHGFVGVTTNDYTNKKTGETNRQLKITENAQIYLDEAPSVADRPSDNSNKPEVPLKTKVANQAAETKESYERQAALKAAVDFTTSTGLDSNPDSVVAIAEKFYAFFSGNS